VRPRSEPRQPTAAVAGGSRPALLADGTHAFTEQATDPDGTVSTVSAALDVTLDDLAPNAPDIVSDAAASSTSVIVTAEAGSTVKLYEGTQLLGSAIADAHCNWDINSGSLSEGSNDFTATTPDVAGNVSQISSVLDAVIGPPPIVIESAGSTSLDQVGTNYYLESIGSASGPELQYDGMAIFAGELAAGRRSERSRRRPDTESPLNWLAA
jgi:hypothetical protein